MKKLFLAGLVLCGLFVAQHSYSQDTSINSSMYDTAANAQYSPNYQNGPVIGQDGQMMRQDGMMQDGQMMGSDDSSNSWSHDGRQWNQGQYPAAAGCCDEPRADQPCDDKATGECWCKYVHYEPCYYYTRRCVTDNKYCTKRCCRQVPKYYQVQRCRYVPQYYCETCCKYCPEYYDVQQCIPCQRWVCDRHCKYVPRYYYKHVCGQVGCTTPCPTCPR